METSYVLKISDNTTWRIVIVIKANDVELQDIDMNSLISVSKNVFLQLNINFKLSEEEVDFLKRGILKVLKYFNDDLLNYTSGTVIKINELDFAETDYQPEGLYWAIIGWLAQRYEFTPPKMEAYYDREQRKYIVNTD